MDVVDQKTRSRIMASIRGKDTKPERVLRSALHARGFRFRLHDSRLPGRPDIVLPKYGACIFVHGCFWRRHWMCKYATTPATRHKFWNDKFQSTVKRDQKSLEALERQGYRTAVVWECSLKHSHLDTAINSLVLWLKSTSKHIDIG